MKRSLAKLFQSGEKKRRTAYEGVVCDADAASVASQDVFKVISDGSACRLRSFIKKNRDGLSKLDDLNATPLHHAAEGGQLELMQMIIDDSSAEVLNVTDSSGNTPLHWATKKKQAESVKLLLSRGANPNVFNSSMMAPLHLAVQCLHNEIVKIFVENSSTDVNLEGESGNTPILVACYKDNHEALKLLLENGGKVCKGNNLGCMPIHAAAFSGSKLCMEMIIKKGEELGYSAKNHINFLNHGRCSPLHLAVQSGDLEMIKMCIEYGAQIDLKQSDKCTALHFAATQGATEILKLMMSSYSGDEPIVDALDGNKETLLHRTALFDHYELAEYLISMGAKLDSVDIESRTPLLLATSCASWKIVNLLLSKGANVDLKDHLGRNFLHLTVLHPGGLQHLNNKFFEMKHIKDLITDEDNEGCTPMHYACRQGVPLSVNILLGLNVSICSKSRDKKSPLHFAASYGRINTCQRLLQDMEDTRLLNEGDKKGMTPLHLAAQNGHEKVVQFLLKKGSLFLSDYKGWTALHHAGFGGYTRTMRMILDTNVKCTDKVDEEGNTALHLAAREGHANAVKQLLDDSAKILLNKADASFLHEAIHNGRKEVVNAVILHKRWEESVAAFSHSSSTNKCPILEMVEYLPESLKLVLDNCIIESSDERSCRDFSVEYNFRYLQCPLKLTKKLKEDQETIYEPLITLNSMVRHNRVELLSHPVCREYLYMKWMAYGFRAHLLNLAVYSLGLIPLTLLITRLGPEGSFNGTHLLGPFEKKDSYFIKVCMCLVFIMSLFGICKEMIQLFQQKLRYLLDYSNLLDWTIYTTSIIFVSSLVSTIPARLQWECGAIAIFLSWMNFLLYLQRFENCGIYIVMFWEILRTLIRITFVFFFLMLAFGLSFHVLLGTQQTYKTPYLSVMQTFAMMLGDINYHEGFLEPLLANTLPYPFLSFFILIIFTLLIPVLLMNLLIGLAVGDIAEVQKFAALKRIAMQVNLHTNLEKKIPYWFLTRVDQESITIYPNRPRYCGFMSVFQYCFGCDDTATDNQNADKSLELEVLKQKYRLKDIAVLMEKQHDLLKLVLQKMEIISEAEDEDTNDLFQHKFRKEQLEHKNSKWDTVLKAVKCKSA
ncbi:transient receptor potential cation channel subfamily A member 1 [Hemicordylus capensis]|uniref:transient receptor potential cation channel subfamily A member 1 n=1 Tax=Hemicordylus capensis TaxID=884348 RepID=UPI002303C9CD|nr:transient receptor potential cation channel subfamily A member 1 [Hemicordylus capensis]XP_053105353.1 transient receptor potential cation channel subfamily A member 1 [Hemicordylus capensis]XP_053105354.1 transient receptor potential cation channel subfamily A member 1 [Hemicordylus capensis]